MLIIISENLHLVPRSKNEWSYTSILPLRLHGVVLSYKHRDNFTFHRLPLPMRFHNSGCKVVKNISI